MRLIPILTHASITHASTLRAILMPGAVVALSFGIFACDGSILDPFPKLDAGAYTCPEDPEHLTCWSLAEREAQVDWLDERVFHMNADGTDCRLTHPTETTTEFICGMLLLGVRNGVPISDLNRIELVTGGTITQFQDELHSFTELRVEPGMEVQAIKDIVFNPDLRFVNLNVSGPAASD